MSIVIDQASADFLQHHGVLGMKWGHHKAQSTSSGSSGGGGSAPAKKLSNRQLNKISRKKENEKRNAAIDAARERYNNTARDNYLKAKAQYKIDKKKIGSHAARLKFNEVADKNVQDYELATQAKSGKEKTVAVLGIVGTVALASILHAASSSR